MKYLLLKCCKSAFCVLLIFLVSTAVYAQTDALKSKYDTTYIKQYRQFWCITLIGNRRDFLVNITNPAATNQILSFTPRNQFSWGLGFDYKWFTIELTSKIPFQKLPNDHTSKRNQLGIRIGITGQKFWFSSFYQRYKGMEGSFVNMDSTPTNLPSSMYLLRNDIFTTTLYTSLNYGFNYRKYSQMAALWQIDRQMKSAGSFVVGIAAFAYNMQADSTLVPSILNKSFEKESQVIKSATKSMGINGGYVHTFVIKKKFFVHGGFIPSLSFQQRKYVIINEENLEVRGLAFSTELRVITGYNGEKWFGGFAFSNYSFSENSIVSGAGAVLSYDFMRFFTGFRINPKVKIPLID
jgi:hypothetical protein